MKELIKNEDKFQIVESGTVLFSTPEGPQMLEHLSSTKYPILYIRNIEIWQDK